MNIIPRKFYLDDIFDDFIPTKNNMKCDIYERENEYNIEIDVPGFSKDEIKIQAKDGYLTVSAEKNVEDNDQDKNYIRRERIYGRYERTFYLGNFNDTDVMAEYKDGTLKIKIPKKDENEEQKYISIK